MREIWDSSIARHIFNMYHSQLQRLKAMAPSSSIKILDVGCAQATLAIQLAEQGHKVTAVDLRQHFLDYAKTRWTHGDIEFIQGNVMELNLGAESFDLIYANQIIEHLVYPLEMLTRLSKMLKPGGKLIVTTPNGQYIKNKLPSYTALGDPKQWEEKQFTADGDGHFFAYLDTELNDIFTQTGLTQIQTIAYESPWISGHMKFRYLHALLPYRLLNSVDKFSLQFGSFSKKISHQLLVSGVKG